MNFASVASAKKNQRVGEKSHKYKWRAGEFSFSREFIFLQKTLLISMHPQYSRDWPDNLISLLFVQCASILGAGRFFSNRKKKTCNEKRIAKN